MLKSLFLIGLVLVFGATVVFAEQPLPEACDPYHIGQSSFTVSVSDLSAAPANDSDAFAMQQIGINPQVLLQVAGNVSEVNAPVIQSAPTDANLAPDTFAKVTPDGDNLKLYAGTCAEASVLTQFRSGTQVTVLDGPFAAEGLAWWRVRHDALTGWVIEGEDGEIWLQGSN